ncbi:hypothetical protein, partial [Thalassovita sp. S70]|uniref:hypothetical protein n=1 Tax=Thalassovita sp. S70 TaxID=3415123 RepID=UPI003C7C17AC
MTDRPINLTDWQVRAALNGRLSLVVEPIKPQPVVPFSTFSEHIIDEPDLKLSKDGFTVEDAGPERRIPIRRATGDRLWGREAWRTDRCYDDLAPLEMGGEEPLIYTCDDTVQRWGWRPDALSMWGRIRRPQHMPRWASRLTLIVTDVRVMRVQEIGDVDANKAGLKGFISADGQDGVSPREELQDT